jgi:hypothetical protein
MWINWGERSSRLRNTRFNEAKIVTITGFLDFIDCPELKKRRKHKVSETDLVSETCFLVFRIPDDGRNPETQ